MSVSSSHRGIFLQKPDRIFCDTSLRNGEIYKPNETRLIEKGVKICCSHVGVYFYLGDVFISAEVGTSVNFFVFSVVTFGEDF